MFVFFSKMKEGSILAKYIGNFFLIIRTISSLSTLRKDPGHSDVIYVVENVLNYFLWLNSSNGWPANVGTKSGRSD